MGLDLILELRQLFVAGHAVEEVHHLEGLALVDELHLLQAVVGLGLLRELLKLAVAFLGLELLGEAAQADSCDGERFAFAEAERILHHRVVIDGLQHRRRRFATMR